MPSEDDLIKAGWKIEHAASTLASFLLRRNCLVFSNLVSLGLYGVDGVHITNFFAKSFSKPFLTRQSTISCLTSSISFKTPSSCFLIASEKHSFR